MELPVVPGADDVVAIERALPQRPGEVVAHAGDGAELAVAVGERDAQPADALQSLLVGDEVAVGTAVAEAALFRPLAPDAVEIEVPTAPDAAFPGHVAGQFCENGAA